MTPMKRFSGNIQEMRENLKTHFKEISLNKSEPKYNRKDYTTSKGVDSDFILIFSEPRKDISFALAFDYIGLDAKEQNVTASIKKGKTNTEIESSQVMLLPEFKEKINEFNKIFKEIFTTVNTTMQLNPVSIMNKFSEIFLEKKLDLEKELHQKQEDLNELIETVSKELKIPETRKAKKLAIENLAKAQEEVKKQITQSEDFKTLMDLKKQVHDLEKKINTKTASLETSLKVRDLKKESDNTNESLIIKEYELEKKVASELSKMPKIIQKKLKPKF